MTRRLALAAFVLATLAACTPPTPIEAAPAPDSLIEQVTAAVVAVREQVQEAAPTLVVASEPEDRAFTYCATALITRWEISGQAAYERRYSGVYYPAGAITASGPTWGVGYDGGHNTRFDILRDWSEHRERERLSTASGVTGAAAKARIAEWAGITVRYPLALGVFAAASLPSYTAGARRVYGSKDWDSLEAEGRCGLVGNGYNRGFAVAGPRRAELRHRRDVCMPMRGRARLECLAADLLAEQRLWPESPGLRNRRADEARTVLGRIVLPSPPPESGMYRRPGLGAPATFAALVHGGTAS